MNTSLLREISFQHLIQNLWKRWQAHKKYYSNSVLWWERYVKRTLFTREATDRRRDRVPLEKFYYEAISNILHTTTKNRAAKAIPLKHLNAKITRLHHYELKRIVLNNDERDMIDGEEPTLYHFKKAKTRRDSRIVSAIQDSVGVTNTTTMKILLTFSSFLRTKYDNIPVDDESIRALIGNINNTLPPAASLALDAPLTIDKHQRALKKGKHNNAPGSDGISQEYFKTT